MSIYGRSSAEMHYFAANSVADYTALLWVQAGAGRLSSAARNATIAGAIWGAPRRGR